MADREVDGLRTQIKDLRRVQNVLLGQMSVLRTQMDDQDERHAQDVAEFRKALDRLTAVVRAAAAAAGDPGGELVELRPHDGGETE